MVEAAKNLCEEILTSDPELNDNENQPIKSFLQSQKEKSSWSKIS